MNKIKHVLIGLACIMLLISVVNVTPVNAQGISGWIGDKTGQKPTQGGGGSVYPLDTVIQFGGDLTYVTYSYIDVANLMWSNKAIEQNLFQTLMQENINLMNLCNNYYGKITGATSDSQAQGYLRSLTDINSGLAQMADAQLQFAKTGDQSHLNRYNSSSKEVKGKIDNALPPILDYKATDQGTDYSYLEATGAVCASYIYTSFAYIGLSADAYSAKVYTAENINTWMEEQKQAMQAMQENITALRSVVTDQGDIQAIDSIVDILKLLNQQADGLAKYALSGSNTDANQFDQARTTVWPKIKTLLNIK